MLAHCGLVVSACTTPHHTPQGTGAVGGGESSRLFPPGTAPVRAGLDAKTIHPNHLSRHHKRNFLVQLTIVIRRVNERVIQSLRRLRRDWRCLHAGDPCRGHSMCIQSHHILGAEDLRSDNGRHESEMLQIRRVRIRHGNCRELTHRVLEQLSRGPSDSRVGQSELRKQRHAPVLLPRTPAIPGTTPI